MENIRNSENISYIELVNVRSQLLVAIFRFIIIVFYELLTFTFLKQFLFICYYYVFLVINIIISLLYFIVGKIRGRQISWFRNFFYFYFYLFIFFLKISKFYSGEIWILLLTAKFNSENFYFLEFAEIHPMPRIWLALDQWVNEGR